jgi:cytochrome P450
MSEIPLIWFPEKDFQVLFLDLAQGASDTTGGYLETFFLHMILYPDVQEKVFQEIQDNIPEGQEPSFSDLKSYAFTGKNTTITSRRNSVKLHFVLLE